MDQLNNTLGTLKETHTLYAFLISFGAAVGGFLFGYDLSVISSAQLLLEKQFNLTASQLGFATSSAILGCIIGPLAAGAMSDWLGRKKTLIYAALLLAISAIGTAIPKDMLTFNVFRIVGGVGVGLASVVSPMYIAEIAPARIRGGLVTVNQLAIVTGALVSLIVGHSLATFLPDTTSWRWMFASECVPIAGFVIYLAFVPRSPRWLAQKEKKEEALAVLTRIQGRDGAVKEIKEIEMALKAEKGGLSELLRPGIRMALFIAINLAILQQWCGVAILSFYMPKIYQMAGATQITDAIQSAVYTQGFGLLMTILAFWLVDKIGRRPLLMIGSVGMAIGLALMGGVFYFNLKGFYSIRVVHALLIMLVCQAFYLISFAPLAWLIMSEVFPTRIRGRAMGLSATMLWIAAFMGVSYFPKVVEYFERLFGNPSGAFLIFTGVCIYSFLFCWKFVPETKGRTLEEISISWIRNSTTEGND